MFTRIPSATLKQLVKLSERKEALMEKIQAIDREMVRLQSEFEAPESEAEQRAHVTVSGAPGRKSKRGGLKRASGKRARTE